MGGRYAVQQRLAGWGRSGQARLAAATAVVVGVGALGGAAAGLLARAGVGRLRLVDPDHPTLENLHRQVLYTEADVDAGRSKVEAARRYLSSVNRQVAVEAIQDELDQSNAAELLAGADVVIDGLDHPRPRYHLNRACLAQGVDWVHAGVVGTGGQLAVIRPGKGPCFECWAPPYPPAEPARSSATHGIFGPLPSCLASLQAAEALKLLLGADQDVLAGMLLVDLWPLGLRTVEIGPPAGRRCPACGAGGAQDP